MLNFEANSLDSFRFLLFALRFMHSACFLISKKIEKIQKSPLLEVFQKSRNLNCSVLFPRLDGMGNQADE